MTIVQLESAPTQCAPTQPVTLKRKRYIYVCAGCDLLDVAERNDKTTCSGACRVRAMRSGRLKLLREIAASLKITVAGILQADAVHRLRQDLSAQIKAGALELDEVQPEMYRSFLDLLKQQMEATQ